jgi:hypothetical protein
MSSGKNLQEMEVGTKQSKTAVNSGARPAEPMPKLAPGAVSGQTGGWEDLGGPTPENYRPDDNSSELKTGGGLKSVSAVTKGAKAAEAMPKLKSGSVKEEEELEYEEELVEAAEEEEEDEDAGEAKKKAKKKSKEDDEDDEEEGEGEEKEDEGMKEEYDIEEDVNALVEGEDLSEEFKDKARVIFESALRSKVSEIQEALEVQYEEKIFEAIEEIKLELQERVDNYLEYVADEWLTQNELAVERGIKEELTSSFLSGMKGLFEEHYVEIPEDKYDVLEGMVDKLDDMETKLNEQIERNIYLNGLLSESVADRVLSDISSGLAATQKEKLASLSESVEFESESQYREKMETLKESYFPNRKVSYEAHTETLSEGLDVAPVSYSDSMNSYLRTLSSVAPIN